MLVGYVSDEDYVALCGVDFEFKTEIALYQHNLMLLEQYMPKSSLVTIQFR